ncbi:MAG: glycosyltransferase [Planctomycetota bacterium]|jgi:glycosyltransferase involved in cell wall biosynthesis
MRALIVSPQPFFTPRGTPLSVYYRTLVMTELGVQADLLTYGEGQAVDMPGLRTVRIPRLRALEPVKVGPSMSKVILDLMLAGWAIALMARHRYEVVHAHEESIFICRFLRPIFRFKLVYEMHSSLPRQLTSFRFTRSQFLIRLFEALENSSLRAADAVVTISPSLARYAKGRMPDERRHFLIENSIIDEVRLDRRNSKDLEEVPDESVTRDDRVIIGYAGTFEPYQGLDMLLKSFREVREERSDVVLLLIGGTPDQVSRLQRLAEDLGVGEDCVFTGRVDQSVARRHLAAAALVTSPRLEGTSTPLKVYEQLAAGIPLVATRIEAHTEVLDESLCWLCDPAVESLAEAILASLGNLEEARRRAEAGMRVYQQRYSRSQYVEKMERLLESLR